MNYTINDIAAIVKGEMFIKKAPGNIEHLLLDSRKVVYPSTSLFFALQGPRRNGHQFIRELYDKGVCNFVVQAKFSVEGIPNVNVIVVQDTLNALQALAEHHRKQYNIPVIGITGSNGKTIVKEWLNQLLEDEYQIVRSPKSYNSQTGVPLSVWQMNGSHRLGIFEAGISETGEMDKLEKIIQPAIGVLTNIGEAHSGGFENIRQKVDEKLRLFKNVTTLIYCKDYPSVNEGIASYLNSLRINNNAAPLNLFDWSYISDATLGIISTVKDTAGTIILAIYNQRTISIRIPFTDDASVENSITCWAVLLFLNIAEENIQAGFKKLAHIAMRLELKKGINNCSLINDSYSADLSSLKIALDFLSQQQQHHNKTVILSDFLQSGKEDTALYQEIADAVHQKKIQRLIGIGHRILKQEKLFKSIPGTRCVFHPDVESFLEDFNNLVFDNEAILLKGARVFEFERISRMLEQKVHQTVLEIDRDALLHNLREYQKLLKPSTRIMAMVKAFSYGSGSYEIAGLLQFHQVDYLAVAYADEGVELRKAGITLPVMVMNAEESTFDALIQFRLEPDIYSFNILQDLDLFLRKKSIQEFPVHIELETGMHRLGFELRQVPDLIKQLKDSAFKIVSVFSHLVASEDPAEDHFTKKQAQHFITACDTIEAAIGYSFIRHIANSAAISRHAELQMDMVRLGIGLYGIDSVLNYLLDLKEVSCLKTTIAQIKQIPKGDTIGYGRKAMAQHNMVIATVRLGYADGYPRRLSNGKGSMFVHGHLAPVIGNICMDMTMIDITGINGIQEGDEVIVFGKELPVSQVAAWAETIPYEIMTGVSQRVKRIYYE